MIEGSGWEAVEGGLRQPAKRKDLLTTLSNLKAAYIKANLLDNSSKLAIK